MCSNLVGIEEGLFSPQTSIEVIRSDTDITKTTGYPSIFYPNWDDIITQSYISSFTSN
jgi:hypothetical protein